MEQNQGSASSSAKGADAHERNDEAIESDDEVEEDDEAGESDDEAEADRIKLLQLSFEQFKYKHNET